MDPKTKSVLFFALFLFVALLFFNLNEEYNGKNVFIKSLLSTGFWVFILLCSMALAALIIGFVTL